MTARTTLVVAYTIVIVSLTFAIAVAVAFMAANAFPTQMAYAQNVQTTPPSTSAPTFTPPGASTPTYTSPSDNSTTNSTSGNATK